MTSTNAYRGANDRKKSRPNGSGAALSRADVLKSYPYTWPTRQNTTVA